MKKLLARFVLYLMGIKIVKPDPFPDKCVLAVVPHTSNWDFPLGIAVRALINEKVAYVGKSALFKWPHGFVFRWLGGVPVDRSTSNNFVQGVVDIFNQRKQFRLVLAPEGTRSKVTELKSGFYYIAKSAGVPLILCAFDIGKKEVRFDHPFYPTDDKEKDFEYIYAFFEGTQGFVPENGFRRA